jgi:hypothetical protein
MLLRHRGGNDESSAAHRHSDAASATLTRDEFVCVLLTNATCRRLAPSVTRAADRRRIESKAPLAFRDRSRSGARQ